MTTTADEPGTVTTDVPARPDRPPWSRWHWTIIVGAGASSAYPTVSEIFPMETRALAIAFFYAVGTAAGGITGPLVFAKLTGSGAVADTVPAFQLGAGVMTAAGVVAAFLAVPAERRSLESVASPLSAVRRATP